LNVDPLVDVTGQPYAYTGDDPVNEVDSNGLVSGGICGWLPGCGTVTKIQNGITRGIQNAANNTCNAVASGVWWPGCVTTQSSCNPSSAGAAVGATTIWNTDGLPSLKVLHSRTTIESDPNYSSWSQESTENIVRSLYPGGEEPLLVNSDGLVLNGNTRITILQDRGYDVDSLPRELLDPLGGIGDDGFPDLFGE